MKLFDYWMEDYILAVQFLKEIDRYSEMEIKHKIGVDVIDFANGLVESSDESIVMKYKDMIEIRRTTPPDPRRSAVLLQKDEEDGNETHLIE